MNNSQLKLAVSIFANNVLLDKSLIIKALESEFKKDGKKLFYFLPITFGWIIFSRLGVTNFSKTIRTNNKNNPTINVQSDNLFVACLKFAEDEMTNCFKIISKNDFETILYFGAEGKIAKKAFSEGRSLKGAKIEEPYIDDVI